jgi:hypothetical protein
MRAYLLRTINAISGFVSFTKAILQKFTYV